MSARNIIQAAAGAGSTTSYVDDVFSTYLYTGNDTAQTINNGIDLSGGMFNGYVNFDGTGDYLITSTTSAGWQFGTGDFTVECFIKQTTLDTGFIASSNVNAATGWHFRITDGKLTFGNNNVASFITAANAITTNEWHHIAVTRQGGSVRLFQDGVLEATAFNSTDYSSLVALRIGSNLPIDSSWDLSAQISNLRIVKGTALYTATFTPTFSPLLPVSGTAILCCNSSSATADLSTNNLTLTVNGNASVVTSSGPFTSNTGSDGLVWIKSRSGTTDHALFDTIRGNGKKLSSNGTSAQSTTSGVVNFDSTGFSVGGLIDVNTSAATYSSWTFRKAPKFFDIVTYTGNGGTEQQIPHSLGTTPGMIIVKRTNSTGDWYVCTPMVANWNNSYLVLNSTAAVVSSADTWQGTSFASATTFGVKSASTVNTNGATYVAYLFAHDTAADGLIQCGSYVGNGSSTGPVVTLGWEPQWVMIKKSSAVGENWYVSDVMRQSNVGSDVAAIAPNSSAAENTAAGLGKIITTATGFYPGTTNSAFNSLGETYIYLAIRRPNKPPTSGTGVFNTGSLQNTIPNFPATFSPDVQFFNFGKNAANGMRWWDRLRGNGRSIYSYNTNAETGDGATTHNFDVSNGVGTAAAGTDVNHFSWLFRRAPGFMDVVCYTGTTSGSNLAHGLGAVPELLITRVRNFSGEDWIVHYNNGSSIIGGYLNITSAFANSSTAPSTDLSSFTSTTYTLNTSNRRVNGAYNYVAYLFASLPGISKVGSYIGNGSSQTINCGFSTGARFVMIKDSSAAGDWYVWDSARGIVANNDPHLSLNTTAAEVTTNDSIDPDSTGFIINQVAATSVNFTSNNYIYLAIS